MAVFPVKLIAAREASVDKFDRQILALLRSDARTSISHIAREVNLSRSAVSERIRYSVEKEHCRMLNDFVFRRTALGFSSDQGRSQIEDIADMLATAANWTDATRTENLEEYFAFVARSNAFR